MSQCQVVCPAKSTYNAVNIRINNPRANISEQKSESCCSGDYNAINLEINNPELRNKPVYSYPEYNGIVTADMANVIPLEISAAPIAPVSYRTSYTYICTDCDKNVPVEAEAVSVPEPYVTTTENEKTAMDGVSFKGINFKAAQKPEIVGDAGMTPAVDIDKVIENLSSPNYDVQAKQLEQIIYAALKDQNTAVSYITAPVFSGLISIAEKDTSALEGPTEEQIEIRKKIITDEIFFQQQLSENKKPEEIELPYKLTEAEVAKAMNLSPMELAERNKEYAILTLAALTKVYAEEFEKKTGNIMPFTDLPGVSTMVSALKDSQNPSVKIAAIESLVYINRAEYKDEISTILGIAAKDKNRSVARVASEELKNLQ